MRIRCKETVQPCRERRAKQASTGPLAELDVVIGADEGAGVCCAAFRDISAVVKAPEKEKNRGRGGGEEKVGAAVLNVEVGEARERGRGGDGAGVLGVWWGGSEGEVLGKVGGEWCWGAGVLG